MKGDWVNLREGNDWMYIYYAEEPLTPKGTADRHRGGNFKEGEPVEVRLPSGEVLSTKLVGKHYVHDYSDMGHPCSTSGYRWGVRLPAYGREVWFELSQVEVPRSWAVAHGAAK